MTVKITNLSNGESKTFFKIKMVVEKGNSFQLMYGNNRRSELFRDSEFTYKVIFGEKILYKEIENG